MSRSIRVVTWNVWWRFGQWRERQTAIGNVLRWARPDICGLQEVWADAGRNLTGELAEELGMHCVWVRSPQPEKWRARLPGSSAAVGNAILARWPIRDSFRVLLPPGSSGDASRTAIVATVESPDGRIPLATTATHLGPMGLGDTVHAGPGDGESTGRTRARGLSRPGARRYERRAGLG